MKLGMTMKATKKATSPRVADQILEGLREAVAFERGELTDVPVDRVLVTSRDATAEPPTAFEPSRIMDLRKTRMGVSQSVFASILNVSPETVRAWEQGKNPPGGPALRLLEIADERPDVVIGNRMFLKAKPALAGRFTSRQRKPRVIGAKGNPAAAFAGTRRRLAASTKVVNVARKK
ncbi:MAG TPA: helix-turn-helix domain-containing protein [Gemmatimonadaceae bacterium]